MSNKWIDKYKNGEIVPIGDTDCAPWTWGMRQGGMMNEKGMNQNLLDFKKVMDKYRIPFIFIFGSALGLMRPFGKPWSHPADTDVDIMCNGANHIKMRPVVKELEELGFFVPDPNMMPLHDHCFMRNGEKIELWWFDDTGEDMYYSERVWYPRHFFDNPFKIKYLNQTWLIPHDPIRFLEITYGRDWRTPRPEGSYILSTQRQVRKK